MLSLDFCSYLACQGLVHGRTQVGGPDFQRCFPGGRAVCWAPHLPWQPSQALDGEVGKQQSPGPSNTWAEISSLRVRDLAEQIGQLSTVGGEVGRAREESEHSDPRNSLMSVLRERRAEITPKNRIRLLRNGLPEERTGHGNKKYNCQKIGSINEM